jgi:trimeric autotransporter adhesin
LPALPVLLTAFVSRRSTSQTSSFRTGSRTPLRARLTAITTAATLLTGVGFSVGIAGPASAAVYTGVPASLTVTAGQALTAYATDGADTVSDVSTVLGYDKVPTGGSLFQSVIGRSVVGAGRYEAKVVVAPDTTVSLSLVRRTVTGVETTLGTPTSLSGLKMTTAGLRLRVLASGVSPTTLRAKLWSPTAVEPTTWGVSTTDTTAGLQAGGVVGVGAYLGSTVTNGPVVSKYTGFAATAVPAPAPAPVPAGRATAAAGSLPVGSAQYAVPTGARYVSATSGSDSAAGTPTAPWRTVANAIAVAPSGSTIVLRTGTYFESVTVPSTKKLTIQAYPGEAVWFDGSKTLGGWVADGTAYRVPWAYSFDNSPTYTSGAADNTQQFFGFVNSTYPMASHPEQVFVDGVPQTQVSSRTAVVPGSFFADTVNDKLFLGSNPTGHEVRSSVLTTAVSLRGAGSALLGVGVRRYATSLPLMGTLRALATGVVLENVLVSDNATQGVFLQGTGLGVRNVTSDRNGSMGIAATYADGLKAVGLKVTRNNNEHFNSSPSAGGFKLTKTRGISIKDSVSSGNDGSGIWMDESCYDATLTGNDLLDNAVNGMSFEISSKGLFVNNLVVRNGGVGMKFNDAQNVSAWNNTMVDNKGKPMWMVQDSRQSTNLSTPGHDPRQTLPDPTVTWVLGPITFKDNVVVRSGSNCLLCTQDSALYRSAETIGIVPDGNVYNRPGTTSPTWVTVWASGLTNPYVYTSLSAFKTAKGRDLHSLEVTGPSAVDAAYKPTATVLAQEAVVAQPLDAAAAAAAGRTTGERHMGAWLG